MASVGIRELKANTSEILRRVTDDGETIEVTRRGEVIATIQPTKPFDLELDQRYWERQRELIRASGENHRSTPIDVLQQLDEERREFTPDETLPVGWKPAT